MTDTKATRSTTEGNSTGFTEDEKAAMKERARELKAEKRKSGKADGEADLLAKVAEMPDADKAIAERIHAIVRANAPDLQPKTWYGMPAYARDGKVVCFFKAASKFGSRYAEFGFNEDARLDDGSMWPTVFALTKLTPSDEERVAALLRKAVG